MISHVVIGFLSLIDAVRLFGLSHRIEQNSIRPVVIVIIIDIVLY